MHDCTLITALVSVLLLTAASVSASSISAINNNQVLTLLGVFGYADQLFTLDSSCSRLRNTVKLNACFVTVCVPVTTGTFHGLWEPVATRLWGTWVCQNRSHMSGHAPGHCVALAVMPRVPSEAGWWGRVPWGLLRCRSMCLSAHMRQHGCELLLTMLISAADLRRTVIF